MDFHDIHSRQAQGGSEASAPAKKIRGVDHLVEVLQYDLSNARMIGVNHLGEFAAYGIDKASIERCEALAARISQPRLAPFLPHLIDAEMAKAMPPGRKVVLSNAKPAGAIEGVAFYEAERVFNSTAQTPDKLLTGIFTATRRLRVDRIGGIQKWEPRAFSATDPAAMSSFIDRLDFDFEQHAKGQKIDKRGFQIRALTPSEDGSSWILVDSSWPYDYTPSSRLSADWIGPNPPISKALFIELCKQYEAKLAKRYPQWSSMGVAIDICPFVSFKASERNPKMSLSKAGRQVAKLVSTLAKTHSGDARPYAGRSAGVQGILELTVDSAHDGDGPALYVVKNIAQKFHANNRVCDVRAMVEAFDGKSVALSPSLAVERRASTQAVVVGEGAGDE